MWTKQVKRKWSCLVYHSNHDAWLVEGIFKATNTLQWHCTTIHYLVLFSRRAHRHRHSKRAQCQEVLRHARVSEPPCSEQESNSGIHPGTFLRVSHEWQNASKESELNMRILGELVSVWQPPHCVGPLGTLTSTWINVSSSSSPDGMSSLTKVRTSSWKLWPDSTICFE